MVTPLLTLTMDFQACGSIAKNSLMLLFTHSLALSAVTVSFCFLLRCLSSTDQRWSRRGLRPDPAIFAW